MRNIVLVVILLHSLVTTVSAQVETKPVQRHTSKGEEEEYNVLAADKNVWHGPYVRYRPVTMVGMVILEMGSYDHGQKEGEWRTFSHGRPWNKLVSVGRYHAGQPDGVWQYYHYRFAEGKSFGGGSSKADTAPNSPGAQAGYSVSINDTTAVIQAQGQYAQGVRIGVWTYYNREAQVIQKVNHFTNQLLYWRPYSGAVANDAAAALNHPVLYLGGKARLQEEIYRNMDPYTYYEVARSGITEFDFAVDSMGHQTGVVAGQASPTRYEKLLLKALEQVPPTWLPQVVAGKPVRSRYRVRITTRAEAIGGKRGISTEVRPLGT